MLPIRCRRSVGFASSHTLIAWVFMAARVLGLQNAPPPVDKMTGELFRLLKMVLCSISLNFASPLISKILRISSPDFSSIIVSLSTNDRPKATARRLPSAVFPDPISPTRTMGFFVFGRYSPSISAANRRRCSGVKVNICALWYNFAYFLDRYLKSNLAKV